MIARTYNDVQSTDRCKRNSGPWFPRRACCGNRIPLLRRIPVPDFPMGGLSGKLRPTLERQNGMRFPVEVYSGKRVPESALRLGCNFPIEPLGEAASRNPRSKRDMVSQTGLLRKMQPGIPARNGTHFPSRGPMGNCIPESAPKPGRSFRAGDQKQSCGGIVPGWAG